MLICVIVFGVEVTGITIFLLFVMITSENDSYVLLGYIGEVVIDGKHYSYTYKRNESQTLCLSYCGKPFPFTCKTVIIIRKHF